jgi:hypothetical protein
MKKAANVKYLRFFLVIPFFCLTFALRLKLYNDETTKDY